MPEFVGPLLSRSFGGWAPIDSPPQRTADTDLHWSLVIVIVAAIAAMASIVFNINFTGSSNVVSASSLQDAPPATTASLLAATPEPVERQFLRPQVAASPAVSAAEAAASVNASPDIPAMPDLLGAGIQAATTPEERLRAYLGLSDSEMLPVSFRYEVQPGDTAARIAERFGLEEATILFNNFDIHDRDHLNIGQVLTLPPVDGLVYTVQYGDTLFDVMWNFQGDLDKTLAYPANGLTNPEQIYIGQSILLVLGSASLVEGRTAASTSGAGFDSWTHTNPTFNLWLAYSRITDLFGVPRNNAFGYHTGVDYAAPLGEWVGAAAPGQISAATWDPSYGNWVEIDHGGGYRTRYAHLDVINVWEGQWVSERDFIGTVGNTGYSSGPHLHFEIIVYGQPVNPLAWLN